MCVLIFAFEGRSQNTSFSPYQSILIGYEGYLGFEKSSDIFSNKTTSENLLMEKAYIPYIGLSHYFNSKGSVNLKLGYGFIKSSSIDTVINSTPYTFDRKLRDVKIDIEFKYIVLNTSAFGVLLSGEIGMNYISEIYESLETIKYTEFGFGLGAGVFKNQGSFGGLMLYFKYYKLGNNNLFGGGIGIPIYSFNQ